MANNKHILIATTDAAPADVCKVIDPQFLIARSGGRYKFWFSNKSDLDAANKAAQELGAVCEVISPPSPVKATKARKKATKKTPNESETDGN
jgi:hypothetical protein